MKSFEKAMKPFFMYGDKVVKIVERQEPKAKFSMRFLALCWSNNLTPSAAARQIIDAYRDTKRKNR